ncbi:MAG: transposase [bacterium]|nr:transposase [bacterium]
MTTHATQKPSHASFADRLAYNPERLEAACLSADAAWSFVTEARFPNGIECPRCGSRDLKPPEPGKRVFVCRNRGCPSSSPYKFTARVGTPFSQGHVPLEKVLVGFRVALLTGNEEAVRTAFKAAGLRTAKTIERSTRTVLEMAGTLEPPQEPMASPEPIPKSRSRPWLQWIVGALLVLTGAVTVKLAGAPSETQAQAEEPVDDLSVPPKVFEWISDGKRRRVRTVRRVGESDVSWSSRHAANMEDGKAMMPPD